MLGGFIAIIGLFAVYVLQKLHTEIQTGKKTIIDAYLTYHSTHQCSNMIDKELIRIGNWYQEQKAFAEKKIKEYETSNQSNKNAAIINLEERLGRLNEIGKFIKSLEKSEDKKTTIESNTPGIIAHFIYALIASLGCLAIFKIFPLLLNVFILVCVAVYSFKLFFDTANYIKLNITSS